MRPEPAAVARDFIAAFSAADFGAMRGLLAADLIAHITNADGGADGSTDAKTICAVSRQWIWMRRSSGSS
ncbi:hypothetical protein NJB18001_11530 [Mycobacterium marinum]|uniref:hypothetical protein n=1 Tax=Mycobacterium marinum TaxID=1781 RepID=UPI000EEAE31A|nr:hypothetical protein [Mycobacterium marinum]RFZ38340.1 hypothetical protein KST_02856 [Mycobacterium marinum]GJO98718.1 hypothetical protein NJB18001_11530 [Mycobacterium marinum]